MGFGFKSSFLGLSSKKQKPTSKTTTTTAATPAATTGSPKSAIRKSDKKTPIIANKTRKDVIKTAKSVRFDDCSCNRSVKVSPSEAAVVITKPISVDPDANMSSNAAIVQAPRRAPSVCSSASSGRAREVKTTAPPRGSDDHLTRLPSPRGLHSRNLSYGTIYNASKSRPQKEDSPRKSSSIATSNALVRFDQGTAGKAPQVQESKSGKGSGHVFGLGGCNYGHGSIINGTVKTLKGIARESEASCSKMSDAVKEGSCLPFVNAKVADELKNAGNEEYKRGMYTNAISMYDKAIALYPRNAVCHNNKAVALAALGKLRDAIEECLEAITCDPTYSRAHFRVGTLYTRLGRVEDARKHFKLSGLDNGSESLQRLVVIEVYLNNMRSAIKAEDWRRVLQESGRAIEAGADACNLAIAAKAEALLKLHRPNEALENLEAAKKIEEEKARKDCSRLLLIETQVYFYLGRFEEAVNAAEHAAKLEFDTECLVWLKRAWGAADAHRAGDEYYRVGKYIEACAMYSQGLHHLPTNGVLLCNRAACRSRLGQWASTIEDCNAALKSYPDYSEALLQRAYAHARLGHWEDARRDYIELSKMRPGDTSILTCIREMQAEIRRAKRPTPYVNQRKNTTH
ncbi:TPR repeat-containing thioredoxin TTL4-like protein [Drosera capensis]